MRKGDIQTQLEMLRLGVLPHVSRHDFIKSFSALEPEERRRAARKFRKMWRKLVKRFPKVFGADGELPLCAGGLTPNYVIRARRRALVYRYLRCDIINK